MTLAQVVPLVLFTVQFFLWNVGLYTAPVALSLAHILCSSPICNAHSKHYNIFLSKISFFIGFTLKPAILSDTETVMTMLHFCLFCLFCSHEHLSLLLSSHGCFHVPCFFLETFPGSCLGGPLLSFFHTTYLTLTMVRPLRWQRPHRSSFAPRMRRNMLSGSAHPVAVHRGGNQVTKD